MSFGHLLVSMPVIATASSSVPAASDVPDTELLQAWVRHQREADFTEIVRRHLGLVRGTAKRQLGVDQADDIAQIVFAILARKAPALGELRSLGSWLHRVTLLQCRGMVRNRIRERRDRQTAMEMARLADGRDPLSDALPYLDAAIHHLPASDRELIHLRYSDRLTFPQIAARTGRTEAALRQQAVRAVEKLGGFLQRRGVAVPVSALAAGLGCTLAGTSSVSAAGSVSKAAITAYTVNGGPWIVWSTLFIMNTTKCIFIVVFIATLITSLGVWRNRRDKDFAGPLVDPSMALNLSNSSSPDAIPLPTKTKTDRSRAVVSPSQEELETASKKDALRGQAITNARKIGMGLFEFETEFGAFPNQETAAAVTLAGGGTAPLGSATANDCFYQLVAARMVPDLSVFTWEESDKGKKSTSLENCGYSYLYGMTANGRPDRPLAVAPLEPGKSTFDREVFGGMCIVLSCDLSVRTVQIEADGTALINGKDIFDPTQPFWEGGVPPIKWPAK